MNDECYDVFFTLILLLILIAYQFVDFHVAANVAHMVLPYVEKSADKNVEHIAEISAYLPYLTRHTQRCWRRLSPCSFSYTDWGTSS